MTFTDAVRQLSASRAYDAAKRPAMGGYVFRSAVSTEEGAEGDFTLTFRKRENSDGSPVDYTYGYDAGERKWTVSGTTPELDGELFGELLGDDWQVGLAEDFESTRVVGEGDNW